LPPHATISTDEGGGTIATITINLGPNNPPMSHSKSPTDGPHVLSRLQALFGPSSSPGSYSKTSRSHVSVSTNAEAGPSRVRSGTAVPTAPPLEGGMAAQRAISDPVQVTLAQRARRREVRDRNALVVKLVTWNMGDALVR
jgi:hypothetical protein